LTSRKTNRHRLLIALTIYFIQTLLFHLLIESVCCTDFLAEPFPFVIVNSFFFHHVYLLLFGV
jgi:hypothetical protein